MSTDIVLVPRSREIVPTANPPASPASVPDMLTALPVGRRLLARGVQALNRLGPASPPAVVESSRYATIACIIPAYNEEETIGRVLEALLAQTRLPDVIHVIVNNTSDSTKELASEYAGHHHRDVRGVRFNTTVHVHDIGKNPDKKVGALNHGYNLVKNSHDFVLGVDGDTVLERDCLEWLEGEIVDESRIGGISSIYTLGYDQAKGRPLGQFYIAGQRAQFRDFNFDNLRRGRQMAVLGGQCSLFRVSALEEVKRRFNQSSPWVNDSEVEDSLLSLQIKSAGYLTKISAHARAEVGGMTTMRSLYAQQRKWNYGSIDLMWPGFRGNTKGQPFHPNLRLRWYENWGMLINGITRLMFVGLLTASLWVGVYVFNPIWLTPVAAAVALNMRMVMMMRDRDWRDVAFALLAIPAEVYMWVRLSHFVAAWVQFLTRGEVDNWGAQARAEKGSGGLSHLWPFAVALSVLGGLLWLWTQQTLYVQAVTLAVLWPILLVITLAQTSFMIRKLARRSRGFKL